MEKAKIRDTLVLEEKGQTYLEIVVVEVEETYPLSRGGYRMKFDLTVRTWKRGGAKLRAWSISDGSSGDLPREKMVELALFIRNDFLTRQHQVTDGWQPPSPEELALR